MNGVPILFTDSITNPISDLYADVEQLKQSDEAKTKRIESLARSQTELQLQFEKTEREREKAIEKAKKLQETLIRYAGKACDKYTLEKENADGSGNHNIKVESLEKENEHLTECELDDLIEQMQEMVIMETKDPEELGRKFEQIEQYRRNAANIGQHKILVASGIAAVSACVIMPLSLALCAKIAGCTISALTCGPALGAVAIGGFLVGLVTYKGTCFYAKWRANKSKPRIKKE